MKDCTIDCTKDCYYFRDGKCRREGTGNECRLGYCLFYAPIPYRVKKEEFNCFGAGSGGVHIKKTTVEIPSLPPMRDQVDEIIEALINASEKLLDPHVKEHRPQEYMDIVLESIEAKLSKEE